MRRPKLYDLSYIIETSRGNTDFVKKMIDLFIFITPESVQKIKQALRENDLDTIAKTAHKIKPSIKSLSINSLIDDIVKLEKCQKDPLKQNEINQIVQHLEDKVGKVVVGLMQENF
ncbi:MAG: Hpt domain-containing protein [Candidatus Cyclobacteriaceae bacterium M3_2C_046]